MIPYSQSETFESVLGDSVYLSLYLSEDVVLYSGQKGTEPGNPRCVRDTLAEMTPTSYYIHTNM